MIRKLPPHLVQQIAAGEVIERPASALKELIENSLDAHSRSLRIQFERGGLGYLSVDDDGDGIKLEDLPLSFAANATSKLFSIEDFLTLKTLGFRGEALSSIASVASAKIWSCHSAEETGGTIMAHYGHIDDPKLADRRQGTCVEIKDLFSRLPARLQFLKSERAETLALHQIWKKYALARPDCEFDVKDRLSQKSWKISAQPFLARVLWFFDADDETQWFEVNHQQDSWQLKGFALQPRHLGKGSRGQILLFLNGRPIRDQKIEIATRKAFESYTEFPREISAVVYLDGNPEEFDVNVHPTKMEVRFRQSETLFSFIIHSFREELSKLHRPSVSPRSAETTTLGVEAFGAESPSSPPMDIPRATLVFGQNPPSVFSSLSKMEVPKQQEVFASSEEVVGFRYLGQVEQTYLLASRDGLGGDELYIFDQHALHERILYERFLKTFESEKKLPSQRLLFPERISLEGAATFFDHEEILERLGFEIREWTENTLDVLAVPSLFKASAKDLLMRLQESLHLPIESLYRESIATIACHSAVRAHDRLQTSEVERLFQEFGTQDSLGHCPHGRPTFVRFTKKDLEKLFHRLL